MYPMRIAIGKGILREMRNSKLGASVAAAHQGGWRCLSGWPVGDGRGAPEGVAGRGPGGMRIAYRGWVVLGLGCPSAPFSSWGEFRACAARRQRGQVWVGVVPRPGG
ncbi:unnamed protein product [Ostreobium quekettii]|uniref:Uncharacterized protein n=1 Tax=Ostreobium quekettii TaxID=121088 RepID=A0A8S1IZY0_9CHLO|nr:unnamed protein product [Ostreobium quekettii]